MSTPNVTPPDPEQQKKLAALMQTLGGTASAVSSNLPQSGGTEIQQARPGQLPQTPNGPPQMAGGTPGQGIQAVQQAQRGPTMGQGSAPGPQAPVQAQLGGGIAPGGYATKSARNGAIMQGAIQDFSKFAQGFQQQMFQKKVQMAGDVANRLLQANSDVKKAGMAVNEASKKLGGQSLPKEHPAMVDLQTAQQRLQGLQNDPKIAKVLKNFSKPGSPESMVFQQKAQEAQKRASEQDELESKLAEQKAQTDYLSQYKAQIQQQQQQERERHNKEMESLSGDKIAEQKLKDDAALKAKQAKLQLDGREHGAHVSFGPDNQAVVRQFTEEERKADPELQVRYEKEQAYVYATIQRAKQGEVRNAIAQQKEARLKSESQLAADPTQIHAMALQLADPNSGFSWGRVPKKAVGNVLADMSKYGIKAVRQYNAAEYNKMDLANAGYTYLARMDEITQQHPELFGPGEWGKTKLAMAMGDKNDRGHGAAVEYTSLAEQVGLPMVGIHGAKGQKQVKQIQDYNGNYYQKADAAHTMLQTEMGAMKLFRDGAARPAALRGSQEQKAETPAPVADKPQRITVTAEDMK
jgi:hypothetical protein